MSTREHIKISAKAKPQAVAMADLPHPLFVSNTGTVIVEVSSAVRLLKENGTLDAIKKYMQPRYEKR